MKNMASSIKMSTLLSALLVALGLLTLVGSAPAAVALTRREVDYANLLPTGIEAAALSPRAAGPVAAAGADADAEPEAVAVDKRSAELYWGPHDIGNLRLKLTNPHMGYAGTSTPLRPGPPLLRARLLSPAMTWVR